MLVENSYEDFMINVAAKVADIQNETTEFTNDITGGDITTSIRRGAILASIKSSINKEATELTKSVYIAGISSDQWAMVITLQTIKQEIE